MSSPANKDSADGPKPTARQMEILTLIFQNMRSKPDIDVSPPLANDFPFH